MNIEYALVQLIRNSLFLAPWSIFALYTFLVRGAYDLYRCTFSAVLICLSGIPWIYKMQSPASEINAGDYVHHERQRSTRRTFSASHCDRCASSCDRHGPAFI